MDNETFLMMLELRARAAPTVTTLIEVNPDEWFRLRSFLDRDWVLIPQPHWVGSGVLMILLREARKTIVERVAKALTA